MAASINVRAHMGSHFHVRNTHLHSTNLLAMPILLCYFPRASLDRTSGVTMGAILGRPPAASPIPPSMVTRVSPAAVMGGFRSRVEGC
jgi:hypothetical protein